MWKSDGTAPGTVLVRDVFAGPGTSNPRLLTDVSGTLFFVADDGVHGAELWKSDGTEAGTVMVKDLATGALASLPYDISGVSGTVFFTANDSVHGRELWKSDGTEAGTIMVKDIQAGADSSDPQGQTSLGGVVYFSAFDSPSGRELWRSDGTEAGTVLVADINPGVSSSAPGGFTDVSGTLFFHINDATLWKTDGTSPGTLRLHDSAWASNLVGVNGVLYFKGYEPGTSPNPGLELWRSDGTRAGTVLVKDIAPGVLSSAPQSLTRSNTRLFFAADDGFVGEELWTLDTKDPTVISLLGAPHQLSADVSAVVTADGGSPVLERGFLFSTTNPTPEAGGADVTKVAVAGTTGPMAATLSGLSPNTPYFLRAFAATANGVGYEQTTFVTEAITGPALSISDVTLPEGNAGTSTAIFAISLSSPTTDTVTVQVQTLDVSAAAGSDYVALAPSTITFSSGVTTQMVSVVVLGDTVLEGTETFKVTLSVPLNAVLSDGIGIGTIVNDELSSRVFISALGADASDCSVLITPCRNISGALGKVAADGEIIVLGTGEYESAPLTITKGVKVTASAGVVAFIRQPITIDAPGGRVVLRGISMKGSGSGNAVTLAVAGALSIEETTIDRWTNGLRLGSASASQVTISNSIFRGSASGVLADAGDIATVSVEGVRFEGNGTGIDASGGSFTVRETTFANGATGISASQSVFDVQHADFFMNQVGIAASTGGTVRLSRSFVFGNSVGLSTTGGGSILSSGTNVLRGNGTDISGALGAIPEQ